MSGELLIYYEVYKGTSKIKTLTSFFIVLSGGYHYYFEDLCWKGNKRGWKNSIRLFKERKSVRVGHKSLIKDTAGRKCPPINFGMFFVWKEWLISRLVTDDATGRELMKDLLRV
jgi:hypothetical protein